MSQVNEFLKRFPWLPALIWMVVIFSLSANAHPPLPHVGNDLFDLFIRKGGHFTEYAILALLFYLPLRAHPRALLIAFLLASLYAATDEWHQTFVPPRDGNPIDWLIDSSGAMLGILIAGYYSRFVNSKRTRINTD